MEEAETHSIGEDRFGVCVRAICDESLVYTEGEFTLCYLLTPHQSEFVSFTTPGVVYVVGSR